MATRPTKLPSIGISRRRSSVGKEKTFFNSAFQFFSAVVKVWGVAKVVYCFGRQTNSFSLEKQKQIGQKINPIRYTAISNLLWILFNSIHFMPQLQKKKKKSQCCFCNTFFRALKSPHRTKSWKGIFFLVRFGTHIRPSPSVDGRSSHGYLDLRLRATHEIGFEKLAREVRRNFEKTHEHVPSIRIYRLYRGKHTAQRTYLDRS